MREPTYPGEVLHEEFLEPMGLTQRALAEHIGVEVKAINRLVNGGNLTPVMASKLARAFKTSPDFWLNLQLKVDVFKAVSMEKDGPSIGPIASNI